MPADTPTLPLVILGGSDRKPSDLPPEGRGKHALSGCKAVDIHIDGRRLIEIVVERFKAAGAFHPIYIAGPAYAYSKTQVDSEVFAAAKRDEHLLKVEDLDSFGRVYDMNFVKSPFAFPTKRPTASQSAKAAIFYRPSTPT